MKHLVSGKREFVRLWHEICDQQEKEREAWIKSLRSQGVKAAHPDDGWVKRDHNKVHLCYPHFDDGLDVGDTLALGWPDGHRLVTIIGYEAGTFLDSWVFETHGEAPL